MRVHDLVLAILHRFPVEPDRPGERAEGARLAHLPVHTPGGDQGLLRDAPAVDAEPAERAAVGERDPGAEPGRGPGRAEAGRAGSDHDEIEGLHPATRLRRSGKRR